MIDKDNPPGSRGDGGHAVSIQPDHSGVQAVTDVNSYSERLKTNVRFDQRLKRNILEITLEKTDKEADINEVNEEDIARVLKTLGIDIVSQTQGYQVHYRGRSSTISVWMAAGINLEKFCRDINIKVIDGVITGNIRPAGKSDVTVKIEGLDFNTPDSLVLEYLGKFGTVKTSTVIYEKYDKGPFQGKYTGERKYQIDFSKTSMQMGTYHLIDGRKVRVFFRGNRKTCGRCHRTANECPGEAIAKNCAAGGGTLVPLSEHMKKLWGVIGFVPTSFEMIENEKTEDEFHQAEKDATVVTEQHFPRTKVQGATEKDIERFDGITIRNFPSQLKDEDITSFLQEHEMPRSLDTQHIKINRGPRNIFAVIEGMASTDVRTMHQRIHFHETQTKFFDAPLYCKAMRKMTPTKQNVGSNTANDGADNKNDAPVRPIDPPKPTIPGLPEKERLKTKKTRKPKSKKNVEDESDDFPQKFLKSTPTIESVVREGFVFSEEEEDSKCSDTDDEAFEDSQESLETEQRKLFEFESEHKTPRPATPAPAKRSAVSPISAPATDLKKLRTQKTNN